MVVWIYKRRDYRRYRFFVKDVTEVYGSAISVRGNKRVKLNRLILRTRFHRITPTINRINPDEIRKIYIQDKIFKRIMEQN